MDITQRMTLVLTNVADCLQRVKLVDSLFLLAQSQMGRN